MSERFFSTYPLAVGELTLDGSEAHHLLHVMRAQPGTPITLFDGHGGEWAADVVALERSAVRVRIDQHREMERELPFQLTLAVPLPKGDRQRWLVEKCAELGVARLVPLISDRTERKQLTSREKLSRYVIEASKQCGRNRLMQITEPLFWGELLAETSPGVPRYFAHREGAATSVDAPERDAFVAVGPEGGFTADEIVAAHNAGWEGLSLGPAILRVETAAVALAAVVAASAR